MIFTYTPKEYNNVLFKYYFTLKNKHIFSKINWKCCFKLVWCFHFLHLLLAHPVRAQTLKTFKHKINLVLDFIIGYTIMN